MIAIYEFDFRTYLLTSAFVFAIYYILKSIIIYTRARIKYLKTLSDISEIVKDEPVVKEAKKRKDEEDEFTDKTEEMQSRKEENIEEKTTDGVKKKTKQTNGHQEKNKENNQAKEVKIQQKPKSKRGKNKKKR